MEELLLSGEPRLRLWAGYEQSVLIGLLTGVGAYIMAAWILTDRQSRRARIQQVNTFLLEHGMTVARWALYLAASGYFYGARVEPSEPAVKQLLSVVDVLGLWAVVVVSALASVRSTPGLEASSLLAGMASRVLSGLAVYAVALWLIGRSGDEIYRSMLANPNDAAIAAASIVIVWMIVRVGVAPARSLDNARSVSAAGSMSAAAVFAPKPTARDNAYTAAHEAGHALVYAALGRLPPDVKLAVNDRPDDNGVLGFMTRIYSQNRLDEKTFAEWDMLVFLAGKMGETVMLGGSTLGSGNDHARWLNVARQYLSNHHRGMFYPEPQNKFEQEQNEAKLEALQAEQLAVLSSLFESNTDVFRTLADALL